MAIFVQQLLHPPIVHLHTMNVAIILCVEVSIRIVHKQCKINAHAVVRKLLTGVSVQHVPPAHQPLHPRQPQPRQRVSGYVGMRLFSVDRIDVGVMKFFVVMLKPEQLLIVIHIPLLSATMMLHVSTDQVQHVRRVLMDVFINILPMDVVVSWDVVRASVQ